MPFRDWGQHTKHSYGVSWAILEGVTDEDGDKLILRFNDVYWAFPMPMLAKFFLHEYEVLERQVIYDMYDESDFVLEAGTGSGVTGLSILRSGAKLVTYEPQLEFLDHAASVYSMNGYDDVDVIGAAIASQDGMVTLVYDRIEWDATIIDTCVQGRAIEVPCVGVNNALKEHGCNALHLDVEGAEGDILLGLDFSLINKLSLEVHPSMLGYNAYDDIIKPLIEAAGFELKHDAGKKRNYPTHNWVEGWMRKE